MGKDKYVITVDEESQGLIINALLLMRTNQLEQGLDIEYIGEVILNVCNAPKKPSLFRSGDVYER